MNSTIVKIFDSIIFAAVIVIFATPFLPMANSLLWQIFLVLIFYIILHSLYGKYNKIINFLAIIFLVIIILLYILSLGLSRFRGAWFS